MKSQRPFEVLACLVLCSLQLHSFAQEWTRFRGPNGTGISAAKTIPSHWGDKDINWKVELPGKGHSSPVIWANKVFVTSADRSEAKLFLYCLNAGDGQVFWKKQFDLTPYALHQNNTFASSTPAVDAQHVYLAWQSRGHYMLTALDHGGKVVWERDLGGFESQHGSGTSPIVYQDTVVLVKDPDGDSFIVAFNCADGKTRWQTPLRGTRADYATPCLYQPAGSKPQLIFTSMEDGVIAFDADTGHPVWQVEKVFSQRCVSSPVLASGLIVGTCGSGGGGNYVAAVRPPQDGSGKKGEMAYKIARSAPYVPTGLALDDLLFLWSDAGIVTCVQAPSGEVKWQERVGGNFFASPICVDHRLFNVSTSGQVVVLDASDKFHELARTDLGEGSHASPAVSGGRLYVRTFAHLMSIGGRE